MDLHARAESIAQLMEDRLDLRSGDLAAKTRRAGRRLPRWVRRDIKALIEAMELAEHPRLQQRVDAAQLDVRLARVEAWLTGIDPWDRRAGIVLNWLAGNAVTLAAVFALALAAMAWRGLL